MSYISTKIPFRFFAAAILLLLPHKIAAATAKIDAISLQGEVVKRGPSCARIRLPDGRIVSLMGIAINTKIGSKLSLKGQWVKRSTCQQGRTFQVDQMKSKFLEQR